MERTAALELEVAATQQHLQEKRHVAEQAHSQNQELQGKVRGLASRYESLIHTQTEESASHTKQLEDTVRRLTAELESAIRSQNDANCSDRRRLDSLECQLQEATSYTQQVERSRQQMEEMVRTQKRHGWEKMQNLT